MVKAISEQTKSSSDPDNSRSSTISPELKQLRGRKVYVQLRAARVRDEIKSLVDQRKGFRDSSNAGKEGQPHDLNQQKIYTTHELARLKSELKSLEEERGSIIGKLRENKKVQQSPR